MNKGFGLKYSFVVLAAAAMVLAVAPAPADAQADTRPVPRMANGKPDFSGVWDHPRVGDVTEDGTSCAGGSKGCVQKGSGPLSFTAEGQRVWDINSGPDYFDYGASCMPWGFTRGYQTPYPHAYSHNPNFLAILWEQDTVFHMVWTDGRKLPEDPEETWRGTSVGHWEGDTLVFQTVGFNGRSWIDSARHPLSNEHKLKYYTKPIVNRRTFVLMEGEEAVLYEYSCAENNRCPQGNCKPAEIQSDN
jgi:hypothetical protein